MKIAIKQSSKSAQPLINRVDRGHRPRVDYDFKLRDWVQYVILEAEKDKNFKKKDQFLSLLKDLEAT